MVCVCELCTCVCVMYVCLFEVCTYVLVSVHCIEGQRSNSVELDFGEKDVKIRGK